MSILDLLPKPVYYHGIKSVLFIYRGASDPLVEYNGITYNCVDLEDGLYSTYMESESYVDDWDAFNCWIDNNPDDVICMLMDMEANWYEMGYNKIKEAVLWWWESQAGKGSRSLSADWETAVKYDAAYIELATEDNPAGSVQVVLDIEDLKNIEVTWYVDNECTEIDGFQNPDEFIHWLESTSYGEMVSGMC